MIKISLLLFVISCAPVSQGHKVQGLESTYYEVKGISKSGMVCKTECIKSTSYYCLTEISECFNYKIEGGDK